MIERVKAESVNLPDDEVIATEYATPWLFQLKTVTLRTFRAFWRQADYGFTRLFSHGIIALNVSLTFLQLGHNVSALEYRVFVMFFVTVIPAIIIAQVEPMFIMGRQTFIREASSKMYSQPIFAFGQLAAEMPYSVLCAVVYFLLYYYPSGMMTDSSRAGYAFLMVLIAETYSVTLGQAVASLTPSIQVAATINPFLLIIFSLFCGVTIIPSQMPRFWRVWMYQLDPFTRLIAGLIVTEMHDLPVACDDKEYSIFSPPSGQQCLQYAQSYVSAVGGYINNPNATSDCQYCTYRSGDEFYQNLGMKFDHRWRDMGIFIGFLFFNIFVTICASKLFRFAKR
jgi:ABC-type multidrug transport system permease subunit